jgi:hypothetical protein
MTHRVRLAAARRGLAQLAEVEGRYLEGNPFRLVHRYDPRAGLYTVRVEVERPVPDEVTALASAVLTESRAALDALAASLASPAGAPNDKMRFPLHDSLPEFAQRSRRALASMSDEAQATIEALQPYHTFGGFHKDALWMLRELLAAGEPRMAAGALRPDSTLGVNTKRHVQLVDEPCAIDGPFEAGAVVASIGARVDGPDPKLDLHFRPSFTLAFTKSGPARGGPLLDALNAIRERIEHAVFPALEPLLPE